VLILMLSVDSSYVPENGQCTVVSTHCLYLIGLLGPT
jgi:hypothetical protein